MEHSTERHLRELCDSYANSLLVAVMQYMGHSNTICVDGERALIREVNAAYEREEKPVVVFVYTLMPHGGITDFPFIPGGTYEKESH